MNKKKLLFLSQAYPYPADGGGKIKTLNSLKTLAKKFDVYAIFISEKNPSKSELDYIKSLGVYKIKVFFNPGILDSVKDNYLHLFTNFVRLKPHYVFQYTYKLAFKFINKVINQFVPDIIHIDHINIAQYLPQQKRQTWILEHHNLEFYLLWTRFIHSSKLSRKLYLLIESTLTFLFEYKTIRKFDHIFTISEQERIRSEKFFNIDNISSQPLVYKVENIKKIKTKSPNILFIGGLGWPPNEDAVEWYINTMFANILKKVPNAEFHIVGNNNPELSKRLPKSKNIILHGYQKDLTKFLKRATIFVLPFRMGGGVRIKSLTALSSGIPIVSTKLGVEGLDLINKKHYLEANNETDFSKQVVKLIKSEKLLCEISKNQIDYLKNKHSEKENSKWLKEYQKCVNSAEHIQLS